MAYQMIRDGQVRTVQADNQRDALLAQGYKLVPPKPTAEEIATDAEKAAADEQPGEVETADEKSDDDEAEAAGEQAGN